MIKILSNCITNSHRLFSVTRTWANYNKPGDNYKRVAPKTNWSCCNLHLTCTSRKLNSFTIYTGYWLKCSWLLYTCKEGKRKNSYLRLLTIVVVSGQQGCKWSMLGLFWQESNKWYNTSYEICLQQQSWRTFRNDQILKFVEVI